MERFGMSAAETGAILEVAVSLLLEQVLLRAERGEITETDAREWSSVTGVAIKEVTAAMQVYDA
jgi:hypothetical protein